MDSPISIFLFIALAVGSTVWSFSRSRDMLERWAAENSYQLLSHEHRSPRRGPFWTATQGQSVYYVTVRDQQGQTRSGWVLCGGHWSGVSGNHVEVRWK